MRRGGMTSTSLCDTQRAVRQHTETQRHVCSTAQVSATAVVLIETHLTERVAPRVCA
ncbi:hypothetical protein BaRGS_00002478, partial [Batillaria attramentaria]